VPSEDAAFIKKNAKVIQKTADNKTKGKYIMIEGIDNSKNNVFAAEAVPAEPSNFLLKEPAQQQNEKKEAYNLSFSDEAWNVLGSEEEKKPENEKNDERDAFGRKELSSEEERQVDELKKIDRDVKAHEQAHLSAAGGYARGGAQYDYVTGPDGNRYANGGHVNLDTSPEKEPEATIRKAEIIRKAALAPANPSPSDRKIAADAAKMAADAQQELAEQRMKEEKAPSQNVA
jgi:hypothetical protein